MCGSGSNLIVVWPNDHVRMIKTVISGFWSNYGSHGPVFLGLEKIIA